MNSIGVFIIIISTVSIGRAFFVENYLRLLQNKRTINIFNFFIGIKIPDDALKLMLIIPLFSKLERQDNSKIIKLRFKINVLTVFIYIMFIMLIFTSYIS